jgi:hypothetical protein
VAARAAALMSSTLLLSVLLGSLVCTTANAFTLPGYNRDCPLLVVGSPDKECVKELQELLSAAGIRPHEAPSGIYDNQTAEYVKQFQSKEKAIFQKFTGRSLRVDGNVGQDTALAFELAGLNPPVKSSTQPTPRPSASPTSASSPPSSGAPVISTQGIFAETAAFILLTMAIIIFGRRIKEFTFTLLPPRLHVAFRDKDIEILNALARAKEAEAIAAAANAHREVSRTTLMRNAATWPFRHIPWLPKELPERGERKMIQGRVEKDE